MFTVAHYTAGLSHPLTLPSVANSILFASFSMVIDVVLGVLIAWILVRTRLPGRQILDSLAMLPLAVPGLVLAFGYLAISIRLQAWFKQTKWLRDLVDVTQNPTLLLVIAYAMRRLPYVVRTSPVWSKRRWTWNWLQVDRRLLQPRDGAADDVRQPPHRVGDDQQQRRVLRHVDEVAQPLSDRVA